MFKVCPSCGAEYQLSASQCSDCDVALELAGATPSQAPSPAAEGPAVEEAALLQIEGPWYLRELAESLAAHDIPSQIDTYPPGAAIAGSGPGRRQGQPGSATQLGIYVRRDDLEVAREVAEAFAQSRLPDLDPTQIGQHDASACPACGEPLAEAASACGACGLEFPEADG